MHVAPTLNPTVSVQPQPSIQPSARRLNHSHMPPLPLSLTLRSISDLNISSAFSRAFCAVMKSSFMSVIDASRAVRSEVIFCWIRNTSSPTLLSV